MTSRPVEDYIEQADTLAQDVVNAWAMNVSAGNSAYLTESFKAVFNAADQYPAKKVADNRREFNLLSEVEAAREKATRETFARAYKKHWEAHQP